MSRPLDEIIYEIAALHPRAGALLAEYATACADRDASRSQTKLQAQSAIRSMLYRERQRRDASRSVTQKEIPPTPPKEKLSSLVEGNLLKKVEEYSEPRARVARPVPDQSFDQFWKKYPLKVAKRAAMRAFESAKKRGSFEQILAGLDRYISQQDPQFYCHAATWLNADRWLDERKAAAPPVSIGPGQQFEDHQKILDDMRKIDEPKAQEIPHGGRGVRKAGHVDPDGNHSRDEGVDGLGDLLSKRDRGAPVGHAADFRADRSPSIGGARSNGHADFLHGSDYKPFRI